MPVQSYTTLDDPLAPNNTHARGINDAGQIVGFYGDSSGHSHGFAYRNGTYTTFDEPFGPDTALTGSNASQIIGYFSYTSLVPSPVGFRYDGRNGSLLVLNDLSETWRARRDREERERKEMIEREKQAKQKKIQEQFGVKLYKGEVLLTTEPQAQPQPLGKEL